MRRRRNLFTLFLVRCSAAKIGGKQHRLADSEHGEMIVILTDVSGNVCGKVMFLDVLSIVKNVSSDVSVRFPLCEHVQQCALSGAFLCPVALSDSSPFFFLLLCLFASSSNQKEKE